MGHPVFYFDRKSVETQTTAWSEFPNGGKAIVEQILALEKRSKSKRAQLWKSVRDPSRKVNSPSKIIWERIVTEFTGSQFHQKITSPYNGC